MLKKSVESYKWFIDRVISFSFCLTMIFCFFSHFLHYSECSDSGFFVFNFLDKSKNNLFLSFFVLILLVFQVLRLYIVTSVAIKDYLSQGSLMVSLLLFMVFSFLILTLFLFYLYLKILLF